MITVVQLLPKVSEQVIEPEDSQLPQTTNELPAVTVIALLKVVAVVVLPVLLPNDWTYEIPLPAAAVDELILNDPSVVS